MNVPIRVKKHHGMQVSNESIVRPTVVQRRSVGYNKGKLDTPIEGIYMVSGMHNKKVLVSNIYSNSISATLKVVNDSDTFFTFKKGKSIGHAESLIVSYHLVTIDLLLQRLDNQMRGLDKKNLGLRACLNILNKCTKITFRTFWEHLI